jgi:hypothetical protein
MDNKLLLQNIQSKVAITKEDFLPFTHFFVKKTVRKKDKLIEEGTFYDHLYLIERGLLFSYKNA